MRKKIILITPIMTLVSLILITSITPITAAVYPYSVSTGDKIPYNVVELKNGVNGTTADWLIVKGLNLSKGDNFFIQIFDRPANPTTPFGTEFTLRFVKGEENGNTFPGNSMIFTSNKTYWENSTNTSFDVFGTIYSYTYEGDIATWAWTTDADNLVTVKFNINDGLLQSYERKTDDIISYGYSHFKFVKGSESPIPGFEVPVAAISCLFMAMVIRKKRKE